MRIGFYAPLKALDHPVPSGDRQMARLLAAALRTAGHQVEVVSTFRSFLVEPEPGALTAIRASAGAEVAAVTARWARDAAAPPDLLFCYHLYYKAPDLIGLPLAERFGLPYVTAEASHAPKRAHGPWWLGHQSVERAVRQACVNFCYTANDRAGLAGLLDSEDSLVDLPPFVDATAFRPNPAKPQGAPVRLVTVAMMRPGDKLRSYGFLAQALRQIPRSDWHLTVVGDGPARATVHQAFSDLSADRISWAGELGGAQIAALLPDCDLFVWPGFNEAFGMSYLEAQACGLPVVAVEGEGTPSVVKHQTTGLLTRPDVAAYASALRALVTDGEMRKRLGAAAADFVHGERSLGPASTRLDTALTRALIEQQPERSMP